jgi:hypothetical protein
MYSDNLFGMDQVQPMMDIDYSENYIDNMNIDNVEEDNIEEGDEKYIIKEKFEPTLSNNCTTEHKKKKQQNDISTKYLLQQLYSKISINISYLFIIFILISVCIIQKNSIDQMKLLLMISINNNSLNNLIKPL